MEEKLAEMTTCIAFSTDILRKCHAYNLEHSKQLCLFVFYSAKKKDRRRQEGERGRKERQDGGRKSVRSEIHLNMPGKSVCPHNYHFYSG